MIKQLQLSQALPEKYVDHSLSGNWHGYRVCQVRPDLVLIYKTNNTSFKIARIETHSEIFS